MELAIKIFFFVIYTLIIWFWSASIWHNNGYIDCRIDMENSENKIKDLEQKYNILAKQYNNLKEQYIKVLNLIKDYKIV